MERKITVVILALLMQACTQVDVFIGGDVIIDAPLPMLAPQLMPPPNNVFREGFYNTDVI